MYSGLSSHQAQELLQQNGPNEILEKNENILLKLFKKIISPTGLMLLLASILSFILGKSFDGYFILILLILNIAITFWQENKADNAIKKLNEHLDQKIKVLRDKEWKHTSSRLLVAGDVIQLSSGEVVPADGQILEANHAQLNESALTGESLPKEKKEGDKVFSGTYILTGIIIIKITATGSKTSFGKTLFSVERVSKRSLLEKDIINISKYLTIASLISVVILSVVFLARRSSVLELLTLDLSLIIAGIPISLPTVMTLIIEFGVLALAGKNVIVRRLSALEDLANVNFLLTDKTGTLTQNKITVRDVYSYDTFTHNDVLAYASFVSSIESENPIDSAILEKAKELHLTLSKLKKVSFIPADSQRKRSSAVVSDGKKEFAISVGAAQVIQEFCEMNDALRKKFDREVEFLASNGFRTLAIAISPTVKEEKMKIVGLLALSDTLRDDARSVVGFLEENGIGVTMVTGDNKAIAQNIAKQVGVKGESVISKSQFDKLDWKSLDISTFQNTVAFAEITPEDKFHLVQRAKTFFTVAANGDGVNDLPALKAANVGIAVKNAVTVLKSSADIVLLSEGISVIRDAIIESRKIFERLYTYSLYRISESLRLIITIAVLGLLYGVYPLTALQIILIALLNDIPIISLAGDRVKTAKRPAKIDVKNRFTLSSLFGLVGVMNSLLLFFVLKNILQLDWPQIQTIYFLKLTVSGHLLIYVAHTKQRWWKFLPSRGVIFATTITQAVATLLAFTGFLMSGKILLWEIGLVWIWAFFWMQISELVKIAQSHFSKQTAIVE